MEAEASNEAKETIEGGDLLCARGQLSRRMQKEGNLWRELWETAKPVPAVRQTPLFDEDLAVDGILNFLEDIPPSELFEQLFVSLLPGIQSTLVQSTGSEFPSLSLPSPVDSNSPPIKREISTMKLVKHPNVLKLIEVMASKMKIYIVLGYVDGGELFDKIAKQGRLKEEEARGYFQQLINAVDYCHSRGVYHRDLKPENLLLDSFGVLKVSDFGLSAFSQQIHLIPVNSI